MSASTPNHSGWPAPARRRSEVCCPTGLFVFAALLAGTATAADHSVKIDAIGRPVPTTAGLTSYRIHSGNPALDEDTLRFREVARQIKTALSGRGLYEARDEESADLIVAIDFGIKECPTRFETTSVPIFRGEGRAPVRFPSDPGDLSARRVAGLGSEDPPKVVGYRDVPVPIVTFEKYLILSARENQPAVEGQPPAMFWRVLVSVEDGKKDLRNHLPVLAAAVMAELGHDTHGPATVTVADSNPAVAFIKQGREAPAPSGPAAAVGPPPPGGAIVR